MELPGPVVLWSVAAGVLAVVVFFVWIGRRGTGGAVGSGIGAGGLKDLVLIAGISGEEDNASVGKTTLFKVLRNGGPPKYGVVSSQVPNVAKFTIHDSVSDKGISKQFVDYPGHTRLLQPLLRQYLPRAEAIIFVVDGVRFASSAPRDGALLHALLKCNRNAAPVLVLINKSDVATCVGVTAVRTRLTTEVDSCARQGGRVMNLAGAEDEDADEDGAAWGPPPGCAFNFAAHAGCAVTFERGSALTGQLAAVTSFLAN